MTDDITVGGRTYYKDLGEWRIRATEGSVYDPYVGEYWNLLDEIERLRADMKELLEITKLFADEGECRNYEKQWGYCTHSHCDWHDAEHLWESFCFARGI